MATISITLTPNNVSFGDAWRDSQKIMSRAATAAMKDAASELKSGARAAIAAGGFSTKWQNAFRVNVYPSRGTSLEPAAYGFSKIRYANIFQRGGIITPKTSRFLWIALPTAPKKIGGRRTTVASFIRNIGPLIFFRKGRHPLLMARVIRKVGAGSSVSVATLKRGAAAKKKNKKTNFVPMFVGLDKVALRRRFNVDPAYQAARDTLSANYDRHMAEELSSG